MIRIDLRCKVQFTDVNGQSFTPSIERILAHELGHMYLYVGRKNMADKADYHKAIDYENIIARELDPEAPIRSVKDHGDPDAWLKKF